MKRLNSIGIQIASNNMDVYLELLSVFESGTDPYNWDVLYLYGVSINKDIPIVPLEEEIQQTKFGKRVSYHDLVAYGHDFCFYDILIVGNQGAEKKILPDEEIQVIYKKSEIVIELFDSSYWRFFADEDIVDKAIKRLNLKYEIKKL